MNTQTANMIARTAASGDSLSSLVTRAARSLASAQTSAEILDAKDAASLVYDAAKRAARIAQAKGAHDELIAKAHRAQADALLIESEAKRRLADEYDAAQERGEVAALGANQHRKEGVVDANTLGLRRDQIHEARQIRDAEQAQRGIVRQTLDRALADRREPTRAELQRSVMAAVELARKYKRPNRRNPNYRPDPLFSAVARFSGLCEELAGLEGKVPQIAAYDEIETTRARLLRNVEAASETLRKFAEVCHA